VNAFLKRPLSGDWPYLWLDATYLKVREGGRIVSVAAIIAVAVNTDGKREIVGLHIGPSEAEPFWTSFLRDLVRRIRLSLASEFNRNASRDLDPVGGSLGTEQCFELGGRLYHR
jgi:transposase-like protein